jgi:hypothetical protein
MTTTAEELSSGDKQGTRVLSSGAGSVRFGGTAAAAAEDDDGPTQKEAKGRERRLFFLASSPGPIDPRLQDVRGRAHGNDTTPTS